MVGLGTVSSNFSPPIFFPVQTDGTDSRQAQRRSVNCGARCVVDVPVHSQQVWATLRAVLLKLTQARGVQLETNRASIGSPSRRFLFDAAS